MRYTSYRGQSYGTLKAKAQQEGQLFEDPLFPADKSSLFYSRSDLPFSVQWKRPKEIHTDARLFVDGADSSDVSQGRLGNCWFVAAAASLAEEKDLWQKVIPDHKDQEFNSEKPENYQGIFKFRFWRFGDWLEVVIDDRLPTVDGELIYIRSRERNEFWSALLEKAYAKLAGSYEALEAGNPAEALVDFTGGVSEMHDLVKENQANDLEKRKVLFQKLEKMMNRQCLTSASIKVVKREEMEAKLDNGLVKGHAYGITAVKKIPLGDSFMGLFNTNRLFMIRLRNPWGQKEWNGPWSDGSSEWEKVSEKEKKNLGIVFENDGEFWMTFEDFCKNFTTVTACRLVNTSYFSIHKTWHEGAHKNKWVKGTNAGGCINNRESFLTNPQYRFDITTSDKGIAMISLMQEDKRHDKKSGRGDNNTIGFFVMQVEANREYRVHDVYEKAGDSTFINSREVFGRFELDPGRYVVVPSTFDPNMEDQFLIRVYTENMTHFNYLSLDKPAPSCMSCLPWFSYPVCQLSVFVVSVDGVKKKGTVSMTMDPYVVIEVEGTKVTTPVKKNNENPKFDYGGLFYIKNLREAQLKLTVWDHNTMMRDTYLGEARVTIDPTDKTMLETHKLQEKSAGTFVNVDGTITIRITSSNKLTFV